MSTSTKAWKDRTIVGITEVAAFLGWSRESGYTARARSKVNPDSPSSLPPADDLLGETIPVWHRSTIEEWARRTGRLQPDGTITRRRSGPAAAVVEVAPPAVLSPGELALQRAKL